MEKELGYLLKTSSRAFRNKVNASDVWSRHPEVNQPGYFVMHYLEMHEDKDVYQKDFEGYFGFNKATITNMLNKLEEQGYIQRIKEDSDGRFKKIVLTEKGKKLNDEIHDEFQIVENNICGLFTEEEYSTLVENLRKVKNYLEDVK